MTRRAGAWIFVGVATAIAACASSEGIAPSAPTPNPIRTPPPTVEAGAPDAAVPPKVAFTTSGARLGLDPTPRIRLEKSDLATDADAVLVHQEFYGLPWDAFEAKAAPPPEWVAAIDAIATEKLPIFLSLQLISGPDRRFLADRAVVKDGVLDTQVAWSAACYDFSKAPDAPQKRAAYLAYVDFMVRRFQPRFVNVAIEMNAFMDCGDGPWNALVDVERAAYDAAKAAKPDAVVFPSIQLEMLYGEVGCTGEKSACFDNNIARLAMTKRDRFAVTSFPYLLDGLRDPAVIPSDWLTRAGDRVGEKTVIAETGWLSTKLVVRRDTTCSTAIDADEKRAAAWLDRVLAAQAAKGMDLVTWVSDRDLLPTAMMESCPCTFDARWCSFLDTFRQSGGPSVDGQAGAEYSLKTFGAMGLRRDDGTPRTFHDAWQRARGR